MDQIIKMLKKFFVNPIFLAILLVPVLVYIADRSIERNIFAAGAFVLDSVSPDQKSTNSRTVFLPYHAASEPNREHVYKGNVAYNGRGNTRFQFIPDDNLASIRINGSPVDLRGIDSARLRDWDRGFKIDLAGYLTNGINTLEIRIFDDGPGQFGLTVLPAPSFFSRTPTILLYLLLTFDVLALCYFVFRKLKLGRAPTAILLLSVFVHMIVLANIQYNEYTYDLQEGGSGHLNYIEYIVDNGKLPPPDGWSFYHPPLYYLSAALVYKTAVLANVQSVYKTLQGLSLLYFIGFLVFAVLILKRYVKNPAVFAVSVAVLAFWPSGFIHAVRIGNDIGFIFLYTAALYLINEWYCDGRTKHLYWGCVLTALTLLTKTNGVLLVGIIGILVLVRLVRERNKMVWVRRGVLAFLICFAGYILGSYDNYDFVLKQGRKDWVFAGFLNVSPADPALYCSNQPVNYFFFDPITFVGEPYISTRGETGKRQYFWNFLYKTSLFGEFGPTDPFHRAAAVLISILFLAVIGVFWAGVFYWLWLQVRRTRFLRLKTEIRNTHIYSASVNGGAVRLPVSVSREFLTDLKKNRARKEKYLVPFLSFALMAAGLLALRLKVSQPCLGDFRYVYPMTVSFAVFFVMIAEELFTKRKKFLFRAVIACGLGFALLGGLFFAAVSWG